MLSKFISVLETRFQNTETSLKNQQASIQGLEPEIGQLSKLISERPQGSLPNKEGVVEPEPKPRQETVVRKGQGEVDNNKNKMVNVEYKPRVPYPNATRKDRLDEQFALSQMPNTMKILKELLANKQKLEEASHVELNAEISLWEAHEPLSNNSKGFIHEERRLQIEGLDEWQTHKSRTHDKPKLRQDELDTSPNQLKVRDKVLFDAADPHLSLPHRMKKSLLRYSAFFHSIDTGVGISHTGMGEANEARHGRTTWPCEPTRLRLARQLSVPEFRTALGLYTKEFKEDNDLDALTHHMHFSPSKCWHTLAPNAASYNPSRSKASVLPPSLSMRMIERRRGTYPPQYRLAQSTEEDAYEDIPDDDPLQHEDPPAQPPTPSCLVHAVTSYANISERLTRFEQQCFQQFDNIDATLQQICQHLHISSPVPPREPSSDEDV
ncbi:hypothetical protein GOBAR_AA11879 [Gossypium barbadense]|uniref:Uncharacterized protein n=1 Tax=Gossypium barbadense TaxID=3634 RepID=A0A2P5XZI5_GOSBA|nr:hypothetical protein GOBAR_AA11879 [Gossypium barbadense]